MISQECGERGQQCLLLGGRERSHAITTDSHIYIKHNLHIEGIPLSSGFKLQKHPCIRGSIYC